jgi:hypothetical protein
MDHDCLDDDERQLPPCFFCGMAADVTWAGYEHEWQIGVCHQCAVNAVPRLLGEVFLATAVRRDSRNEIEAFASQIDRRVRAVAGRELREAQRRKAVEEILSRAAARPARCEASSPTPSGETAIHADAPAEAPPLKRNQY